MAFSMLSIAHISALIETIDACRMHGAEVTSSGRFPRIASSLWVADGPASEAPWTELIPAVSIDRRSVSVSIIRAERRAVQPSRRSSVERNSREGETG